MILSTRQSNIYILLPVQNVLPRTQEALQQHLAQQDQHLPTGKKKQLSSVFVWWPTGPKMLVEVRRVAERDQAFTFLQMGAGQATNHLKSLGKTCHF